MKTLKFIIVAVIFFAAGFLLGQSWRLPPAVVISQPFDGSVPELKVNYSLHYSDSEITEFQDVDISAGQSVLEVLKSLSELNDFSVKTEDYGSLGILVAGIGDKENGQSEKYWQYFVNGQQPMVGAGKYLLNGGETVEWKFQLDQGMQ